jgi:hypothetical protein
MVKKPAVFNRSLRFAEVSDCGIFGTIAEKSAVAMCPSMFA